MSFNATFSRRTFKFRFDARTSRGAMRDKVSWFIKVCHKDAPGVFGIGECGPLPGLSPDHRPDFERILSESLLNLEGLIADGFVDPVAIASEVVPDGFPSIRFGIETALLDLMNHGNRIIFRNSFVKGQPIAINGLVWMGNAHFMKQQAEQKIAQGYKCIKLKVGGLDFDEECRIIDYIRNNFPSDITIRLDANGAFKPEEAMDKLSVLSQFDIHSIEQPVKPGSSEMKELCGMSPIPIALDEELIGNDSETSEMLERLMPSYVILKPTLHGGLGGCTEWIQMAESLNIGWWMTSALESNIGLNAVCQFTANYPIHLPHGLGTGMLYENNFESPLTVGNGEIFYDIHSSWNLGDIHERNVQSL